VAERLAPTISGSFSRHAVQIDEAIRECRDLGFEVLSPTDMRIVGAEGAFLFVASDPVRSVREVQDKHLRAIAHSDFLWLVDPDGYVGVSAALEIGFACAQGVPVLSTRAPDDPGLKDKVTVIDSLAWLAKRLKIVEDKRDEAPVQTR
jgi:nucleoside 2-deoxyribosyltransferase